MSPIVATNLSRVCDEFVPSLCRSVTPVVAVPYMDE
jgi:hypothetical protein